MDTINKFKYNDLKRKAQIYHCNIFLFISEFEDENIFNFIIKEFGDNFLLKNFGGNINGKDLYGRAPIHYLVKAFNLMKFWIYNYKPDINVKSVEGSNAAFGAAEIGNNIVLKFLIKHKCDLHLKNKLGQNIIRRVVDFHYPSLGKNLLNTIKILLDNKVNSFEKDIYNKSAYDISLEDKKLDIIDLLNKQTSNIIKI